MQSTTTRPYQFEGNLFVSDITQDLISTDFKGQLPQDFQLDEKAKLADEIAAAWAIACIDNPDRDGAALLLEFKTYKGDIRRWTMLRAYLAGDGSAIVEGLLSRGYNFKRKQKPSLLDYIQRLGADVEKSYTVTDSSGCVKKIPHWRATSNGIEGIAAAFNHLCLLLDEIALELAHKYGLLPFQIEQIDWAISNIFTDWLNARGGDGSIEVKHAIAHIEHLLVINELSDRVRDLRDGDSQIVRNLLAYRLLPPILLYVQLRTSTVAPTNGNFRNSRQVFGKASQTTMGD